MNSKIVLTETEHKLKANKQFDIDSVLRCNKQFDGFVFVPGENGKIKTGAFITKSELANRKLIHTPSMVIYYEWESKKFFTLADEKESVPEIQPETKPETIGYLETIENEVHHGE